MYIQIKSQTKTHCFCHIQVAQPYESFLLLHILFNPTSSSLQHVAPPCILSQIRVYYPMVISIESFPGFNYVIPSENMLQPQPSANEMLKPKYRQSYSPQFLIIPYLWLKTYKYLSNMHTCVISDRSNFITPSFRLFIIRGGFTIHFTSCEFKYLLQLIHFHHLQKIETLGRSHHNDFRFSWSLHSYKSGSVW